jgi:hypothetical protein
MTGGYLRTNFRREGGNSMTALANGYANTSYAGGAGLDHAVGGGLIFGSSRTVTGSFATTGSSHFEISAYGAMSAFFGDGAFTSGYAIKVIGFNIKYANGAASTRGLFASNSGSMVYVYTAGSTVLGASSFSASFEFTGLIISAP